MFKKPLEVRRGLQRLFFFWSGLTWRPCSGWVLMGLLLWMPPGSAQDLPAPAASVSVYADDPRIQFAGMWEEKGIDRQTVCPGAMVEFRLRGKAEILLRAGRPGSVRAAVLVDENRVWDGLVLESVLVDGGDEGVRLRVVYESCLGFGFDPADYRSKQDLFIFEGVTLIDGADLLSPPPRSGPGLMFLGDSITLAVATDRNDPDALFNTRASNSFAFRLTEWFNAPYAWFAYQGMRVGELSERLFFYRKGQPAVLTWNPDWVFLNLGANDVLVPDDAYREQITQVVKTVTGVYPDARLVLLNFFRSGDKRRDVLKAVAEASGSRVQTFEARDHVLYYGDRGRHPDWRSHASLATALEEFIKSTPSDLHP